MPNLHITRRLAAIVLALVLTPGLVSAQPPKAVERQQTALIAAASSFSIM